MTKQMPPTRPVQTFMPFMFPPMHAPYPLQPPMMASPSTGQLNNSILSLIYNFQQLNNQLSVTVAHVKFLEQYNKLKKTMLAGDQPKVTA